jgi:hypothetical protein
MDNLAGLNITGSYLADPNVNAGIAPAQYHFHARKQMLPCAVVSSGGRDVSTPPQHGPQSVPRTSIQGLALQDE